MKTVSIGDTHGAAVAGIVAEIIDLHDMFIFMGDYVDGLFVDNLTMKKNLADIIELKKHYPGKVILLWGNHDIHYLHGSEYYCSGFIPEMRYEFYKLFSSNYDLFCFSWQHEDVIWTHAGVTNGWFERRFKAFTLKNKKTSTLSEALNSAFAEQYPALFDTGYIRGGIHEVGGPVWCDKSELLSDPLNGYDQVVGHNRVRSFEVFNKYGNNIAFTDVLQYQVNIDASSFYYREV